MFSFLCTTWNQYNLLIYFYYEHDLRTYINFYKILRVVIYLLSFCELIKITLNEKYIYLLIIFGRPFMTFYQFNVHKVSHHTCSIPIFLYWPIRDCTWLSWFDMFCYVILWSTIESCCLYTMDKWLMFIVLFVWGKWLLVLPLIGFGSDRASEYIWMCYKMPLIVPLRFDLNDCAYTTKQTVNSNNNTKPAHYRPEIIYSPSCHAYMNFIKQ